MMAVAISIANAAWEHPHRMTVTGAIAAAPPGRCRRVTLHRRKNPIARASP